MSRRVAVRVTLDPRVEELRETLPNRRARLMVKDVTTLATISAREVSLDEMCTVALPPGGARIVAVLGELATILYHFEDDEALEPDEEFWSAEHDLELTRWGQVRFRVCTPMGQPISGISVSIDHQIAGKTDDVGVLETPMPIGTSRVFVEVPHGMSLRSEPLDTVAVSYGTIRDVVVCLSTS